MQTLLLSHEEEILFRNVIRTQDFDAFTERYFVLPMSGTWFTPEDREKRWKAFLKLWYDTGQPDEKIIAKAFHPRAYLLDVVGEELKEIPVSEWFPTFPQKRVNLEHPIVKYKSEKDTCSRHN